MKKILLFSLMGLLFQQLSFGQCSTSGYSQASINWDALRYLPPSTFVTPPMSANQNFAFGKNKLNITYSNGITTGGELTTHTGETNAYGKGADVKFSGSGTVTLQFASEVQNVKFTIFNIDDDESFVLSSTNSAGNNNITVTPLATANDLSVYWNGTSTPIITDKKYLSGGQSSEAVNSNTSSFNVDITGPVKTIVLTMDGLNSTKDFYLSDIVACTNVGSFPTNYYAVSQPWGTMPGYVLVSVNNMVYMVDPATGNAKYIFSDGATSGTINSLAYDPYNKIVYYCFSLTNNGSANASERRLRKYDMNTGQSTTVLNDISSIGIPTFTQGVESGAAAFYDGALYLGIEGSADNGNGGPKSAGGYESIIWRVDFTSGVPSSAMQVYAVSGDTHDWSDFSVNDGMLYDFNGDSFTPDYMHVDLQTGTATKIAQTTHPRQSAVGWDGKIYWITNQIGQYNLAGNVPTKIAINGTPSIPNWGNSGAPSFGDGAEAFRPKADFGDAPNTYDPVAQAPAVHEIDPNLRLGATTDLEWTKTAAPGTNADQDGGDEDGLPFVSLLNQNGGKYFTEVDVYNNTGAPATLAGWVDFNNNGIFESSEGLVLTVNSNASVQRIGMLWTGVVTSVANYSNVYLRLRLTSASNSMTTASATGYFANGEVEDYKVMVTPTPLPLDVVSFSADKLSGEKVAVRWTAVDEEPGTQYQLEVSEDARNWNVLFSKIINASSVQTEHTYVDEQPKLPRSFYRLRFKTNTGKIAYTNVRAVEWENVLPLKVSPNPVNSQTTVELRTTKEGQVLLRLFELQGNCIFSKYFNVQKGVNHLPIGQMIPLKTGVYSLQINTDGKNATQKLIVL